MFYDQAFMAVNSDREMAPKCHRHRFIKEEALKMSWLD